MKWRVRKPGAKHRALHMWHDWFAWHPVRVPNEGNTMVWMETVKRKGQFHSIGTPLAGATWWSWEYKTNEQD